MECEKLPTCFEGTVRSANVSAYKGTSKTAVKEISLGDNGVVGDAHTSLGDVQVSMLHSERIRFFSQKHNQVFGPGDFAENITCDGLAEVPIGVLDRLSINETEMEVTRIGKRCHNKECATLQKLGECIMPQEGIFLRVIRPGAIYPGDRIRYQPRIFRFKVISLNNKSFAGECEDSSSLEILRIINAHFTQNKRTIQIETQLLPTVPALLKQAIEGAVREKFDVILTTGGTGIGPGDFTYEVVSGLCNKLLPGITDFIRMRYGQTNPHALLSRAIAGVVDDQSLIYTLPGSKKAVQEYLAVLLDTMEHLICVLNGLSH